MFKAYMLSIYLLATPIAVNAETSALLGWIGGAWELETDKGWGDEFWTPPRGGIMVGSGRVVQAINYTVLNRCGSVRTSPASLPFGRFPNGPRQASFRWWSKVTAKSYSKMLSMITRNASVTGARARY